MCTESEVKQDFICHLSEWDFTGFYAEWDVL